LAHLLAGQPALERGLRALEKAAASAAPLLLVGEAGTGRTALARALHASSPRSAGPLVELDPGSIPASLFESELFGYRPGAFTGALQATPGRVERAAGGSLLLDHVEELPLAVQPKLLRLVAEGVYAPLGGRERRSDVRFLSIAAEDLPERVRRGAFREDLFYRLEVLAFRVPPLRERPGDLPGLIDRLLTDLGERFGRPAPVLAAGAREWMLRHPWPGNLRQLKNTLERALVMAGPGGASAAGGAVVLDPEPPAGADRPPRRLEEAEAEEIRRALAYTRGHQGEAARLLGISRKALWAKRKRFGIP
ncbi:MAG TPA: sigma 54-interacting transcriptional regulator, partial [Thermoanaerobaculia bacterium]|nr:sigma 54-interacting transcriptional regulator [Thermoanaerobaculia bacterium]